MTLAVARIDSTLLVDPLISLNSRTFRITQYSESPTFYELAACREQGNVARRYRPSPRRLYLAEHIRYAARVAFTPIRVELAVGEVRRRCGEGGVLRLRETVDRCRRVALLVHRQEGR